MMCLACFVLTLIIHILALPQVGRCKAEPLPQGVLWFCGFTLQPWLGLWDPVVYGEDLVMATRVAPLTMQPGSSWLDFEGLPPAVGVCVLDFGEALAFVRRVVAPVARLPRCGSSVPQLAPGPV